MKENSATEAVLATPRISARLAKRRLKIFSSLVREDSPSKKKDPILSQTQDSSLLSANPPVIATMPDILEPSPPKQHMDESPSRVRRTKYRIKVTTSLRLSNVTMERVQQLQQVLAQYGTIKSLDARRLGEGILVANYFDIKSSVGAYTGLHRDWEGSIQIEYNYDSKEQQLSSINESPDSGGSEKSEEGSDSERKASESLETMKQKLKQEYESLDDLPQDMIMVPAANPELAHNNLSDSSSFDNENLSEGIGVNYTRQFVPQPFPGPYSTPSTALPTESTTNFEDSFGQYSSSYMGVFGENQQFLRTQPAKNMAKPPAMHTHTRSYDLAFVTPESFGFLLPEPQFYNPAPRDQYSEQWYENEMAGGIYCGEEYNNAPAGVYAAGRMKHQETGESKAKYKISLRDVLNGKDGRTTLMIKNIPNKYNQKMLLQKIDIQHHGQYNFFYLPIDFKNNCNVGYAFINFVNPLYILRFFEAMNAKKWEKFNSEKICQLTYGRIQGLEGLLEHFHCSSVMSHQNKKVKPLILSVPAPSGEVMEGYRKELRMALTDERIKALEELNDRTFNNPQITRTHDS